ncbi:Alpha,alpha-trehalose-phosphate synthase [UDP-forming] 1 [Frankliniella fusca]|uniref:Alpha,alpha-trehalose-phosphate synthase [UDP-forming] 1 n=1 Tax=Frankliniella fusca TaxID=407009 RepID=A0AAE1L9J7_9NEOP|nr:Alpha,alpha-trehalose-phosphate synthase [UDP-forming] 1 [Frankliniella fusca]
MPYTTTSGYAAKKLKPAFEEKGNPGDLQNQFKDLEEQLPLMKVHCLVYRQSKQRVGQGEPKGMTFAMSSNTMEMELDLACQEFIEEEILRLSRLIAQLVG